MVLGNLLIDNFFKKKAIQVIGEAIYNACSNGSDHIRLNVTLKVTSTEVVDLSMLYLELIEILKPIHYEFFEKTLSNDEKEKWLLVQLDLKNENVKQYYAEYLEKVIAKKNMNTKTVLNLEKLSKKDLRLLVEKYEESEEIYKFRKAHGYSFKKFRLMVKDHLRYEV